MIIIIIIIIGGYCKLFSAPSCDFSHYKCTRKKKEDESREPKVRLLAAEDESEKSQIWLQICLQKMCPFLILALCWSFYFALNIPTCYVWFWNAELVDCTLRRLTAGAFYSALPRLKTASRADYDLSARTISIQTRMVLVCRCLPKLLLLNEATKSFWSQLLTKLKWSLIAVDEPTCCTAWLWCEIHNRSWSN